MIKVVLYSTGCPKCNILKKKLAAKNIYYTEINDVDEMLKLGIKEVPVLAVNDKLMDFRTAVKWVNNYDV